MKSRFLFFDIKRNFIINGLIVIQIISWIFYSASLISLARFDTSFKGRYSQSYDLDKTYNITLYKIIALFEGTLEEKSSYTKETIDKTLDYLKNENYTYGIFKNTEESIPIQALKSTTKELNDKFSVTKTISDKVQPLGFNEGMIDNYADKIEGTIGDWVKESNNIPAILGSSYKNKFKIGDEIINGEKTYFVKGFFKEDLIYYDYNDVVGSSNVLNSAFVIPLSEEEYLNDANMNPIILFLDDSKFKNKITNDLEVISDKLVVEGLADNLNTFLESVNKKKIYEASRVLIVALMTTASILLTISYKILSDKRRIGILYSIGISKGKIYRIFVSEFMTNIIIGCLIGSIVYIKNCYKITYVFVNEYFVENFYIATGILLLIIGITLIIGFRELNKISPKDMMQGGV